MKVSNMVVKALASSFICAFLVLPVEATEILKVQENHTRETLKHNIQLQLSDASGVPVKGTKFWITLHIVKEGPKVTIQLPLINFVTGPSSNASFVTPPAPLPGGYLYTQDGFLPKHLRPTDIVYRSYFGACNNGASLSFTDTQTAFPNPPSGYIISITSAGGLVVQGAGSPGNIIPPGPQILLPTDISYIVQPKIRLKHNKKISLGFTNTTKFSDPGAKNNGVRDTHVNDAFDGVAAWSWTDNSTVSSKTRNTINAMVAIGRVDEKGKLRVKKPIQLSKLPQGMGAFDTAVAINRKNKNNIVVSYGVFDFVKKVGTTYCAVSFDGGKTWRKNGPTNLQPTGLNHSFGDYRGVASDKYGNIWLSATNDTDATGKGINQPYFAVSTDGGMTFKLVYTLQLTPATNLYDFPQFCFGGDGQGNYGLHFTADNFSSQGEAPVVGFIPIFGLGSFGTPAVPVYLSSFLNNNFTPSITASKDGRVWFLGVPLPLQTSIGPMCTIFKSRGALDQNYAGPWDYGYANLLNLFFEAPIARSQPIHGFIYNCPQSNVYDDKRKALYQIIASQSRDFSQNMRLNFSISRDNGQTWSNPINIANNDFANRGFQSMALDTVRGDLYFGWYDGRNDPKQKSLEYFGAVIPAKKLDKLVKRIPYSNPKYSLGSAGTPIIPPP